MSSAGVSPMCIIRSKLSTNIYQEMLELFERPSADEFDRDADFIFQQDWTPAHTGEQVSPINSTTVKNHCFNDRGS